MEIKWGGKNAKKIPNGETIHLGFQAKGNWRFKKPQYHPMGTCAWFTQDELGVRPYGSIIPGIRYEDVGWHITVYVSNDTGLSQVEFSHMEYTVRSGPVNINSLYWDNPSFEWKPLGRSQTVILGQEVVAGELEASGEKYVIVRMICRESENPDNYIRILFQRRADPPHSENRTGNLQVIVLTGFSLILLAGILLYRERISKTE